MGGRVGRTRTALSVLAITSLALLVCFTASASAREVHVFSKSFGKGELSLAEHSGVAVNQETGEVYVADTNNSRIAKFAANGTPDGALASITSPTFISLDNSTGSAGDLYVVEGGGTVSKRDPTGGLVTSWGSGGHMTFAEELLGLAVNPSGDLWVLSEHPGTQSVRGPVFGQEGGTISGREFDPSGALIRSWTDPLAANSRGGPSGTAVDSADDLYVFFRSWFDGGGFGAKAIGPDGTEREQVPGSARGGASVDPSDGNLYVGNLEGSPNIVRLSPELEKVERFGGAQEGIQGESPVRDKLESFASIAVANGGPVYVVDSVGGVVAIYGLEEVVPPSVTIEPPDTVTQTTAHVVGHIDPNAPTGSLPSHNVAWEFHCTPQCPGHSGYIEVENDGSVRTVEATLAGLEPGTEYSIVLIGRNRGGITEAPVNPDPEKPNPGEKFITAPAPPTANTGLASEVVRGEATLNAIVNSNGAAATYHFEYVTKDAFETAEFAGAVRTPESEPLPSIAAPHPVSARIGGLQAGGDYVYRVVAKSSLGTAVGSAVAFHEQNGAAPVDAACPNQSLRILVGARLPDCRAYELVSPTEKRGIAVQSFEASLQATANGSAVTWYTGESATGVPSPGEAAHQDPAFYISSMNSGGWSSQRLLAPEAEGEIAHFAGLSDSGNFAVIETASRGAGGTHALYLLDLLNQSLTTMVPSQTALPNSQRVFTFDGSSRDDSRIFFESKLQLTAEAAPGKNNLYVWEHATGHVALIGVLPGSKAEAPPGGSFGGAYSWSEQNGEGVNKAVGGSEAGLYVGAIHAISEEGNLIYFTAGESAQLYLRNLGGKSPSTVRVSVPNAGVTDPHGQQPAAFLEATPDGQMGFFMSSGKLTQNANTGPGDEGSDLYRYAAATKTLVDVTPLAGGAGARVQGLLGVGRGGQTGYLMAKGVLASGGVSDENNVYHFEETSSGVFAYQFVAALRANETDWSPTPTFQAAKTSRVSSDGNTVIFMGPQSLNGEVTPDCIYGVCGQIYRYSAGETSPVCVSCNPAAKGLPGIGAEFTAALAPNLVPSNFPIQGVLPRNLSASGDQVFFQTSEPLLPEDVNSQGCTSPERCVDVYEWEAPGAGSCSTPNVDGGCLYLLSSGESDRSSFFVDASADGSNVFFITASSLVPADQDELEDMYDARVEGGIAAQQSTKAPPCASAEACKGAGGGTSPATTPGTQSFQGPGNPVVKPPRCKKGTVLKKGKCVKKHKKARPKKKHKHGNRKNQQHGRDTGKKSSGGAR